TAEPFERSDASPRCVASKPAFRANATPRMAAAPQPATADAFAAHPNTHTAVATTTPISSAKYALSHLRFVASTLKIRLPHKSLPKFHFGGRTTPVVPNAFIVRAHYEDFCFAKGWTTQLQAKRLRETYVFALHKCHALVQI